MSSNAWYLPGKEKFLTGQIDWVNDPIVAVLVGTANYTFSQYHGWLADVPVSARMGVSGTLVNRTGTYGVADADDTTVNSVGISYPVNAIILSGSTGNDATSALICYLGTGVNFTPTGGNVLITWPNGASKIFAL